MIINIKHETAQHLFVQIWQLNVDHADSEVGDGEVIDMDAEIDIELQDNQYITVHAPEFVEDDMDAVNRAFADDDTR